MAQNIKTKIGYGIYLAAKECISEFETNMADHFTWLNEVLIESKRSFSSPEVQLLPKTPSAKRKRGRRKKTTDDNSSEAEEPPSKRSSRANTRKNAASNQEEDNDTDTSNTSTTSRNGSSRATRSSARNKKKGESETESVGPPPLMSIVNSVDIPGTITEELEVKSPVRQVKIVTPNTTPKVVSVISSPKISSPKTHTPKTVVSDFAPSPSKLRKLTPQKVNSPKKQVQGFGLLASVREKASAYMGMVLGNKTEPGHNTPVKKTPVGKAKTPTAQQTIMQTPPTHVQQQRITDTPNSTTNDTIQSPATVQTSTFKSTAQLTLSIEKSPKTISNTDVVLESDDESTAIPNHTPIANINQETLPLTPVVESPAPEIPPTETEAPQRRQSKRLSKRASLRCPKKSLSQRRSSVLVIKARQTARESMARRLSVSSHRSEAEEQMQVSEESTGAVSTSSDDAKGRSTRSKLRVKKTTDSQSADVPLPVRSTRSKMRLNKAAPPSLPTTSSSDECSTPNAPTRVTRSKMRAPRPKPQTLPVDESPSSTAGVGGEMFRPPEARATRSKMRKRPAESENAVKRPKKMSSGSSKDDSGNLDDMLADNMSPKGNDSVDLSDIIDKTPSPECPRNKVVRPHVKSFLNNLNKTKPATPQHNVSIVKSFLKRNTPKKVNNKEEFNQEKEDKRRKEMEDKGRKDEDRKKRIEEQLKQRRQEQKKKNEERQKRAAELREMHQKKEAELKKRTIEANNKLAQKTREERLKEDMKEKQKLREKKMAEVGEKRNKEEEIRLQKLKDQEEEQKRHDDMMKRKKEYEEQERQKKAAEQKRLEEERQQEVERERQREIQRIRKQQEDKERERQKAKEEREKELERLRVERERTELERVRERDRLAREQLEREREEERKMIKEAQKSKKKETEEEVRIKNMINKHNTSLQATSSTSGNTSMNTSAAVPNNLNGTFNKSKSNLNTTVETYEITPVKEKKKSTQENYGLDDLNSDDSTDDDEAPKKKIPSWAQGAALKAALINQHYHPPNIDDIFGDIFVMPDLCVIFKKQKARFHKRTSSAVWDSPLYKPAAKLQS
ncbi:unnamed protein product [Owenia fusiformis]|uniref:Inner centromere protein ARK-binding domain-containing protein n=1 Tax=Owenia fusiformis TaxID=6347 RepID=A0A8J1XI84_OWEFU|nr:unnamed protein product [Owenia fusiformis]